MGSFFVVLIGKKIHGQSSWVGIIVVGYAKYVSYCGLIFVGKGISLNPQKFIHLKNFYAHSILVTTAALLCKHVTANRLM